uniref:Uncharacterized protein n=1 Tax=Arundo donax TaxID=35708 RepID=A0A0A9TBK6_ARUDO
MQNSLYKINFHLNAYFFGFKMTLLHCPEHDIRSD